MAKKKIYTIERDKDNPLFKRYHTMWADLPTGGGGDSEIFDEYIDATDQQRNTALANVSNQTANSTTGKMGYKVLDPAKTFAEQVTAENTIYEIRDVFDINGTSENPISLPSNITLRFNGGKLNNGYLTTNSCIVESQGLCFGRNVEFNGTFGNSTIYTKWFDFISADDEWIIDGSNISRNANCTDNLIPFKQVQSLIDNGKTIEFSPNQYLQSSIKSKVTNKGISVNEANTILYISDKKDVTINLNRSTIKMLYTNSIKYNVIKIVNSSVEIFGGSLVGCAKYYNYPDYNTENDIFGGEIPEPTGDNDYEWHWGLNMRGGYLNIHDVDLSYYCGTALMLGGYSAYSGTQDDYVPVSYTVRDVNISYCGRGAVGCLSCEKGSFNNMNLSWLGMPASQSGIMPRDPAGGFGFEFEDLYLSGSRVLLNPYPVFELNNITMTNTNKGIGVAQGYSSNDVNSKLGMKSFVFKNSYIQCNYFEINNLPPNVSVFDNCVIEVNNNCNSTNTSRFENCTFRFNVTTSSNNYFGSICNNCTFTDYIIGEGDYNEVFLYNDVNSKRYPVFTNCKISFHKSNIGYSTFKGCDIDITEGSQSCNIVEFDECRISSLNLYGASSPKVSFNNCTASYIKIGNSTQGALIVDAVNTKFSNCTNYNKANAKATYIGCSFDNMKITTLSTSNSCYIDNCTGSIGFHQSGYVNIANSNLTLLHYSSSYAALGMTKFNIANSVIYDTSDASSVVQINTPTINAKNTYFSILHNYKTTSTTLTDCIINSNETDWTEASFGGIQKNCIFSIPIPTHGDSASRPDASSMPNTYAGFTYFDETLGMPLYLKVDVDTTDPDNPVYTKSWVKADGTSLS